MSMPGCRLLSSDTVSTPDPLPFWGSVDCETASRHQVVSSDGDPHLTATGRPQANSSYRRLTAVDGDHLAGERCELGENDHNRGPTVFYRQGQRRATFVSLRLPSNLPLDVGTWQNVLQMKQAQPSDGGGGVPILYLGAHDNEWRLESVNGPYGRFPARHGVWTRFAFDVYYSTDPDQGRIQVSADLNGDGDFDDGGERTPVTPAATLKTEVDGPNATSDGLAPGDAIPSHLRAGLYHDPVIDCPLPRGCSVEVDNVQVLKSPTSP